MDPTTHFLQQPSISIDSGAHFYRFYGVISMDSTAQFEACAYKMRSSMDSATHFLWIVRGIFYGLYDAFCIDSTAHYASETA